MSVDTPIWQVLRSRAAVCEQTLNLQQVLNSSGRFERLSLQAPHVLLDCSKSLWDEAVLEALLQLAEEAGLAQRRDALYAGAVVNETEQRPALHVRLRAPLAPQSCSVPEDECHGGLRAMLTLARQLREQALFTDVVHIGIGGSGLGPELALQALQPWCDGGPRVHVVSNMDGHDLHQALQDLQPERTLFIVASKSWSTAETQRNMASAKTWVCEAGDLNWPDHFVAVSSREDLARQSGFTQTLHIPEGIGGRFSIWSAVGLPLALAVGPEVFERFLAGAAEMDTHFAQAPLERNAPVWLGLLDVWYGSFLRMPGRCVAPYHHGLRRLPAYLQQLEMESNGKSVDLDGRALPFGTSPVVWGEPGTNGQHAFFQMLHQGSDVVPVEFILVKTPAHGEPGLHALLLANGLAQSQALMLGRSVQAALTDKPPTAAAGADPASIARHRSFPGNRPSTTLVLEALTPRSLGALIAMYEHRVFTSAAIWGLNAFDQWGVELGKALAAELLPRLDSGDASGLDGSTAGLLARLRR